MSAYADRALSARTYFLRNPRRVVPIALVIALVVALEIAVITPTNVFERTADEYIRPLESLTIVTALTRMDFDEELSQVLDANPHMDRRIKAKMLWIDTPAIIGELSSPLLALETADREDLMRRLGLRLAEGRMPAEGSAEAVLHADLARARGMKLGDEFGRIVNPDDATPGRFVLVGELEGGPRLGLVDLAYASIPDFVLARRPAFEVIYAKAGEKAASDAYLRAAKNGEGRALFRVVDEAWARDVTAKNLKNLPLVVGFITAINAVIVAFVVMLISVIGFQARTDEFALFLAVGHRRGRLVRKLAGETALTAVVGWVGGVVLGLVIVWAYDRVLLRPRAIVMDVVDVRPLLYSTVTPLLSAVASALALAHRLRTMDPVTVIQRRGG